MTKLDELHTKLSREFLLSSVFMTSQVGLQHHQKKETFSNLLNNYSNLPVKFASRLSSQKFFKKSRFNFYKNLLTFTANQTSHKNVRDLNKS